MLQWEFGGRVNLEQDGFLATDISEWITQNRLANARWFELAYGLNRLAQRHLLSVTVDDGDMQARLVALLYMRGVTNFQAAILLVERGLVVGARTLARSCFEDAFYLGAVQSSPEYYAKLLHADQLVRRKLREPGST